MLTRISIALAMFVAIPFVAAAQPAGPTILTPDAITWTTGTGPLKGVDMAVLQGDPSKPGPYVVRLRIPDGTKMAAHFHPDTERVTVLSGTLLVGLGDKLDESKLRPLPAGSFVSIPAGVHHYAMARGETIIQLGGNGPFGMTPVAGQQ